ncbi:SMI1/KNR4 family protein [Diaphorobacter caeni]|uniref:SMI1/KNR4 family protein n=1 Tax=Diaphorobacter caeni TaxID=2784387 RepID=UPI0018907F10|nr:SMI1/KNR4 family protein [Diaphorobacter caeni]MBF5007664.1 SMI1/KNR4 family protein [Diaphorobacter caeni]
MTTEVVFHPLGPTEEQLRFAQAHFIRYSKSQKKEFERLLQLRPATPEDIDKLELLVGKIPVDYAEFLKTQNGGRPHPSRCRGNDGHIYVVNDLLALSFNLRFYANVLNFMGIYRNRIPDRSLPIGSSPNGDVFLLSLRNDDFGAVLYWLHELEAEENGSEHFGNVKKVANSFTDFLAQYTGRKTKA